MPATSKAHIAAHECDRTCEGCGRIMPHLSQNGRPMLRSVYAKKRFCRDQCRRYRGFMRRPGQTLEQFFEAVVDRTGGSDACWPIHQFFWQRKPPRHYGSFTFHNRRYRAHLLAFQMSGRQRPIGLELLHSCDNPPCCNPAHLRAGTLAENQAEKAVRGRGKKSRGIDNSMTKLSSGQIRWIRERLLARTHTSRQICAQLRVSNSIMWDAVWGRRAYKGHPAVCLESAQVIRANMFRRQHVNRKLLPSHEVAFARKAKQLGVMTIRQIAARHNYGEGVIYRVLYGYGQYAGSACGVLPLAASGRGRPRKP